MATEARETVARMTAGIPDLTVSVDPPDYLDRLERASMLVGAGGATLSEAACLGVPAVAWPHHDAEARFIDCFVRAGHTAAVTDAAGWRARAAANAAAFAVALIQKI